VKFAQGHSDLNKSSFMPVPAFFESNSIPFIMIHRMLGSEFESIKCGTPLFVIYSHLLLELTDSCCWPGKKHEIIVTNIVIH